MNSRGFDQLIERWRVVAAGLPERRTGDTTPFTMADIALSAFAVFFTQCPSFLSFQQNMEKVQGQNNARALFQVGHIPSDNHIRQTLDPVAPHQLFRLFDELPRAAGRTTHFHSASTPGIVSPGHSQGVPLRPEFITPQDGQVKQDCESNAAKRWLAAHAARYATGNATVLGDDLSAHQPFCRQVLLHGFHFLFTCKPASHAHLSSWVAAVVPGPQLHPLKRRVTGKSNRWEQPQYRWANAVPLTDSDAALKVNWCDVPLTDEAGAVRYRNGFITDWTVTADNVAGLVAAGRARWKIENEHNNGLKNRGCHLEHNFGHGKKHLAALLATMNLLAFGLHTLLELTDESYRLIRAAGGARRKFFQHLEALTTYVYFETWERRMDFMLAGLEIDPHAVQKS